MLGHANFDFDVQILIDLQKDVFYLEEGLNGQMHSSSDAHHLIKKSTPSKISHSPSSRGGVSPPTPEHYLKNPDTLTYPGFFWHTINFTTSGYILNTDGHLMD